MKVDIYSHGVYTAGFSKGQYWGYVVARDDGEISGRQPHSPRNSVSGPGGILIAPSETNDVIVDGCDAIAVCRPQ